MKNVSPLACVTLIVLAFILGWYLKPQTPDPNSTAVYGDTGLPKNCRAVIAANTEGWQMGNYTAAGALDSIERNCGRYGYSW